MNVLQPEMTGCVRTAQLYRRLTVQYWATGLLSVLNWQVDETVDAIGTSCLVGY